MLSFSRSARSRFGTLAFGCLLSLPMIGLLSSLPAKAQDKKPEKLAEPITKGQRVFTCGHSFHVFVRRPTSRIT
jgi:preprotein translocase subunit YajC